MFFTKKLDFSTAEATINTMIFLFIKLILQRNEDLKSLRSNAAIFNLYISDFSLGFGVNLLNYVLAII
ncbi:hypothetical protein C4F50_12210 [Flavobacterium sp. KB82]|uniref:Uncharacterized protein n=1 Tax=Flavobacterium hungaricum TaxID=2082725 RepID=A0ABR9TK91_9FLAO|nr:hypothetical protein [Flavobacterium hungaricum]